MKIKFEDADKIKNPNRRPIEKLDEFLTLAEQLAKIDPPEEILTDVKQPDFNEEYIFDGFTQYLTVKFGKKSKLKKLTKKFFKIFSELDVRPANLISFIEPDNKKIIEFHISEEIITFNTIARSRDGLLSYTNVLLSAKDDAYNKILELLGE